ncbi:hypothetical protein [Actinocrinis sp.]|uniref:hypothetical protein n=1 Tax=Actinocrinis sp. TaxID=1920516 RepID=UPI002BDBB659|nr:hypothetical protein [Actinocrinis sp.]HXR70575.1 hypothetical protein [Actinocrinis sp.]
MPEKSVAAKLLVKPDSRFWLSHEDRLALIAPLPDNVEIVPAIGEATAAVMFADSASDLRQLLGKHADEELAAPAAFWVAYPKANKADINRDTLWPILAERGMRPISQVAIDETWSALRFRALKPGEEFKPGA